jgi:phosphate-selective porin OprO/OprP
MVVSKNDTLLISNHWYEFDGKFSSIRVGGGFLYEYASYIQDENSKEQISMEPAFRVRDVRFVMSGKLKTKRFITWKLGIMYDAAEGYWLVRESGIMVGVPELSGYFFVGRTKEGFSLNKCMVGYAGWTLERQMALDVIPILADGIKYMGFLPKSRLFWNIGVFTDWLSHKQSFSTFSSQFITRLGWLPVYLQKKRTVLHFALNYRYGIVKDGQIQVRSRPEANPAPFFIDTKKFVSDHSNQLGYELYFISGPLMIGSEYYFHKFTSPEKDNPVFQGGEIGATYILTGESRPYSTVSGICGFVPVKKSVFAGGWGAWELVLRYSTLNLNSGGIEGGKFWRITPMVNWYMSPHVRLEVAYGYGVLDRFNLKGVTQFFQSRIQFMLL